jgi:hypothetical protein
VFSSSLLADAAAYILSYPRSHKKGNENAKVDESGLYKKVIAIG